MGHTTRCIPIIQHLLQEGKQVFFAGNEQQQALIKAYFPSLSFILINGYGVKYSKRFLFLHICLQIPKLFIRIYHEHQEIKSICKRYSIDTIISDNRYGLWHSNINSIILTHQIAIQTGMGSWVNKVVQSVHYLFLEKFSQTWIVDQAARPGLAGSLSHSGYLPKNAVYVGWLSTFTLQTPLTSTASSGYWLLLLSGIEPQRSLIEQKLITILSTTQQAFIVIGGNAQLTNPKDFPSNGTYIPYADAQRCYTLALGASKIIARSGYSTLMDLGWIGKPLVLIPTPGQKEQEYLAKHLHTTYGIAYCAQELLSLAALEQETQALSLETDNYSKFKGFL
jgi:UDP-N-acetylglucosamine:LPS N-acetylglucosamine transferase